MMAANILDTGCKIKCPHGGTVTVVPGNMVAKADGSSMILVTDTMIIAGCSFTITSKPSPCMSIKWKNESRKVKVNGTPVLLETSIGLCNSAENAPQGTAVITGVQTKVKGL